MDDAVEALARALEPDAFRDGNSGFLELDRDLARFYARCVLNAGYALRSETIEECAKVAEALAENYSRETATEARSRSFLEGLTDGADFAAEAIRALASKETEG